jgi:hypothetical protein
MGTAYIRSRKCSGLELVGLSLRDATNTTLFSTVEGGGLLSWGVPIERFRAGSLGARFGTGATLRGAATGAGAGSSATGFLVPGGGAGLRAGTNW